jgi:aminoglycoside 3-N-acetyltransferase I
MMPDKVFEISRFYIGLGFQPYWVSRQTHRDKFWRVRLHNFVWSTSENQGRLAMAPFTDFKVRQLERGDVALMEAMMRVFGEAFDEVDTYTGAPPSTRYLEHLLGGSHLIAVAGLKRGKVVGGLVAYELQKFERERSEIYIYDLAVVEAHRRQGVATALIEELKRVAAERNAYVIFVQAELIDAPAIALYTKLGTRADVLHFEIEIGSPTDRNVFAQA